MDPRRATTSFAAAHAVVSEDTRDRLLLAALRLFANQGYAQTSTRELAEAASVNVAAISYYFGDKAGLYRAVCTRAVGPPEADIARFSDPALTLAEVLRGFYEGFLQPLREGDIASLCMKLHMREMLEPTGLGDRALIAAIQPVHDKLTELLAGHLGVALPDIELNRLAVCLAGLGVHVHCGRSITEEIAPGLYSGPTAIDDWSDRLVRFALAMVQAEAARRGLPITGNFNL
ncbi:MAG TPA: CerR family C-terminal domain-containing protein [Rubrivivax sp.]|jgi:AcrR family transcriptional regulator|nr:CerR family C-terminal domain-containing protein [Rubrivivax sp.]